MVFIGDEMVAETVSSTTDIFQDLSAKEIFRLIETLATGYRTVFNLYAIEGYNHKEIGMLLGISEGTSKSQLSKARAILQEAITPKKKLYAAK